jgi:hypothetical protein
LPCDPSHKGHTTSFTAFLSNKVQGKEVSDSKNVSKRSFITTSLINNIHDHNIRGVKLCQQFICYNIALTFFSILLIMPRNQKEGWNMKIGQVIKDIKYNSDFNNVQIAKILCCTQATIGRINKNKQFPNTELLLRIIKLAKKYDVKVELNDFFKTE